MYLILAGLNVIAPGDAGYLWEAVRKSGSIEKELCIGEEQEERKYLEALAESHQKASCWETRLQILSIMTDLTSFKRLQFYIPGLTNTVSNVFVSVSDSLLLIGNACLHIN